MRSSSITTIALAIFVGLLLLGGVLIWATGAGVEYFGPLLVFDGALVSILLLLLAPTRSSD